LTAYAKAQQAAADLYRDQSVGAEAILNVAHSGWFSSDAHPAVRRGDLQVQPVPVD